jgi:hypothetical protein
MIHLKDVELTTQLMEKYLLQFTPAALHLLHASKFKA